MTRSLRRLIACVLLCLTGAAAAPRAASQEESYKFALGLGAGMSGYLGDVNQSNMFRNPGFAGQLTFQYLIDTRWDIRATLTTASLRGDSEQFSNKFPAESVYKFHSRIYDLSCRGEFNFLPYGIGETFKRLKRWTPYIGAGVGLCLSTCEGRTHFSPVIPLAAGFRFKASPRVNIFAEFSATYAFGDHLDGPLTDLQGIPREFLKNTDWHTNILVGITYEFGKRCSTCHYKD